SPYTTHFRSLILANDAGQAVELGSQERAGAAHLRYQRVHGVELGEQAGFEFREAAGKCFPLLIHTRQRVLQRLGAILENAAALGVGLYLGVQPGHEPIFAGEESIYLLEIVIQRFLQLGVLYGKLAVSLGSDSQICQNADSLAARGGTE